MEEKYGLIANDTYIETSLQEYRRLCRLPKGVPKAIPSMCVMTIKRNEHLAPNRAKSFQHQLCLSIQPLVEDDTFEYKPIQYPTVDGKLGVITCV